MSNSFKTTLEHFEDSGVWGGHINVPSAVAEKLLGKDRRVICSINNSVDFQAALMHNGEGGFFVNVNKEVQKKLATHLGDELFVTLEKDESEYGIPVPVGFKELLFQDPDGDRIFHSLTRGKQRTLLYAINKPKSEHLKVEKAMVVFDYLKSVNGKLDFKELNEAFKNSRFKK